MQEQKRSVGRPIKPDKKTGTEMKAAWRGQLKTHNPDKYKKMLANEAKRKRDAKAESKPKGLSNPERVEFSKLKQEKKKLEAEVAELKAANEALKKARDDWKDEAEKHKAALTKL